MPDKQDSGWRRLLKPSATLSILSLLFVGFVGGVVFWGGFNWVVESTNTLEFCISCHEMKNTVYQEWQKTVHYQNRTGVQAICADCHVPRVWHYKMMRKVAAAKEVWGKMTGSIDTKEKFEAKRLELAENEWRRMKASDSRECRNCHHFDNMALDKQKQRSRKQHEIAREDKKTCIDCHKGIAHQKPQGMKEEDEE